MGGEIGEESPNRLDVSAILDRIKVAYGFGTDTELWQHLGITSGGLSNWRRRNTIDLELVAQKCADQSLDFIVYGRGSARPDAALSPTFPESVQDPDTGYDPTLAMMDRILDSPVSQRPGDYEPESTRQLRLVAKEILRRQEDQAERQEELVRAQRQFTEILERVLTAR